MAGSLEGRAEIAKLARLLGAQPERFAYLEAVDPADVRRLREQATDVLFDTDRHLLTRLAAASRNLPVPVVAKIGQHAFGPLLCARIAGLLEPARAVEIARRLPADFLADVALQLDPRRASAVIGGIPPRQIAEVGAELARRGEHVAMGRFVSHLPDQSIVATLDLVDAEDVLRIAFVLEDRRRLGPLIAMLDDEQLAGLTRAAAAVQLWPETLDLLAQMPERRRRKLVNLAAEQDDSVLDGLVVAAQSEHLWGSVLPLLHIMRPAGRERVAGMASIRRKRVLASIVSAAFECDLWAELLPLAALLPPAARAHAAGIVAGADDDQLERLLDAAARDDLWPQLATLAGELDGAQRERLAGRAKAAGLPQGAEALTAALAAETAS